METTFSDAKFLFYTGLRTDDLVQKLRAEREIRDLAETMIVYMDHANQANYSFQRQKKNNVCGHLDRASTLLEKVENPEIKGLLEKISKGFEACFEQSAKPMVLDFSDVQAIAYAAGTYQDVRTWLQRKLTKENPLDARVQEHMQHYNRFKETGNLELRYFDDDIILHIVIASNPKMHMDLREISLVKMFKKCCDYINRQGTLLRLADNRERIHSYYANKSWDQLKRGFKDHDWSWLTANWREDRLSRRKTKEIAGYFQKQAEINGLLFRTLYFACLKLQGDSSPEEVTEKKYQIFMDIHRRGEIIDASYCPEKQE